MDQNPMPNVPKPTFALLQSPGHLIAGATYPLQALWILQRTPGLWGYVIVPILVNMLVGGTLYASLLIAGFRGIESIMGALPDWLGLLAWLLRFLLAIALLLGTGFVLLQFGVLLGSPWYGKLSEELEKVRTGQLATVPFGTGNALIDLWRAVLFELKKLILIVAVGLLLVLLNVVPGLGTAIAAVGGFTLAVLITCLDFFDPALERRRLRFRSKLAVVFRSLPASATFGAVCVGLVSIPLVNLVTIPICVAAGTLFFCDRILPQMQPASSAQKLR